MSLKTPILITNFKAYSEATGEKAVALARIHQEIADEMGVNIAVSGMILDLENMAAAVKIPVLSQHIDGVSYGAYTGLIPVDIAFKMGIDGSILNHSERRLSDSEIMRALEKMRELNMLSIVCAESDEEGRKFAEMGADFVAVEPRDLIGGDVSVSKARPELIAEAVAKIWTGKVLIGAGIKTGEDVRIALSLGAAGVLVASGVVKAPDPRVALRDLCSGLK
jgi:triosephosphate isomerase